MCLRIFMRSISISKNVHSVAFAYRHVFAQPRPKADIPASRGQRIIISVEDEDSEQLCRLRLARVIKDERG
jgi:hypothetical protein